MQIIVLLQKHWTISLFLTLLLLMAYIALFISVLLKSSLLHACQPAADGRKAIFFEVHPSAAAMTSSQVPTSVHGAGLGLPNCHQHHRIAQRQLPSYILLSLTQQTSFSISLSGKLLLNVFMAEETAWKGQRQRQSPFSRRGATAPHGLHTGGTRAEWRRPQGTSAAQPKPVSGQWWETEWGVGKGDWAGNYVLSNTQHVQLPSLENTHKDQRKVCFLFTSSSSHQILQ